MGGFVIFDTRENEYMKKLLIVFGAVAFVVSCSPKTTEVITETSDSTETTDGLPKHDIAEGKVIYLKECSKCHGVKKVEDFTQAQWANILPRMVKQAQLDEVEHRQVKAYIDWEIVHD